MTTKHSVLSISLLCLALGACGDDDGAPDEHGEDGGTAGHAGTGSHAGSGGGGGDEAGSGGASVETDSGSPAGGIEVAGMWMSMYGDETIDDMMWGGSALISYDNAANEAITQGAPTEDDAGVEMDGTFSKIVWTEPKDGAFYYCFVAYLEPTAAAADAASMPADDSDPDNGGCGDGDFPWTKLELKWKRGIRRVSALVPVLLGVVACGDGADAGSQGSSLDAEQAPYASELVSFEPGEQAGYGMEELPDVVLGPPKGGGPGKGSLDVVSLGVGGEIVLGFGERELVDGAGPDLIVFENAFWAGGDPDMPFAEPGEVAVSEDGDTWHTFDCDASEPGGGSAGSGCAGLEPSLVYDTETTTELDPAKTGGDAFNLADLELERAAFVRIRDLSDDGEGTSAGFDLDAIGLIHYAER